MSRRRIVQVGAATLLVVLVAVFGVAWWVSGQVGDGAFQPKHGQRTLGLTVVEVSDGTIVLEATDDSNWDKPGIWGLEWHADGESGYVQLPELVSLDREQSLVTRTLGTGSVPPVGAKARLDNNSFSGDPGQLGLAFETVEYQSPLGAMPAWLVCSGSDDWVIFVHGRGNDREEVLRTVSLLSDLGLTTMAITYRNDEGVPADESGMYRYGVTEWADLEAAVAYALDAGAQRLTLVGWSMGGGIVAKFLLDSELSSEVDAVMLDAPMLDLRKTVSDAVADGGIPPGIRQLSLYVTSLRYDVDWGETDYLARASEITQPILLFHGTEDGLVPTEIGDELAEVLGDQVQYERVEGAHHTGAWNVAPNRYEAAVASFLERVLGAPGPVAAGCS